VLRPKLVLQGIFGFIVNNGPPVYPTPTNNMQRTSKPASRAAYSAWLFVVSYGMMPATACTCETYPRASCQVVAKHTSDLVGEEDDGAGTGACELDKLPKVFPFLFLLTVPSNMLY